MWADKDGRRCFSTAFYADLLAHLGAAVVVSFDDCDDGRDCARSAALAAAGISYCALGDGSGGGAAGRPLSLQSLDRFVSLVAGCPGLVAVHCRDDFHSGAAGTSLAALLLCRAHFSSAAEAVAWMQIARPGRGAGAVDVGELEDRLAHLGQLQRGRSISLCAPPPPAAPAALAGPPLPAGAASGGWREEGPPEPRAAAPSAGGNPRCAAADRADRRPPAAGRARPTSSPHILEGLGGLSALDPLDLGP